MVRIAITAEAFEAICATLPLGSVAYEAEITMTGGPFIWVERRDGGRGRGRVSGFCRLALS
jgi:hypothetical protein